MRFTKEQYALYEAKRAAKSGPLNNGESASPGTEAALHNDISEICRSKGYVFFHGSCARATHRTLGEPDFTIFMSNGRFLLIEVKTKTGKLSPEQQALHHALKRLGHTVHVVRSLKHFIQLCEVL